MLAGLMALVLGAGASVLSLNVAQADRAAALAEFHDRVAEYMRVREEAARTLPPERLFDDPAEMLAARHTLRQAIRHARQDACRGDIFAPAPGAELRRIIAATLAARGLEPEELIRRLNAERHRGAKKPAVNHPYDWRLGAWMWPALLHELPSLPSGLEYRIVDDDLVLVDVRASLVVDILENAVSPAEG